MYTTSSEKGNSKLSPSDETIKFLLNYSKSLSVMKTKNYCFQMIKN